MEKQMPSVVYNTATDHERLIRLFERHGYAITHRADNMVQLSKMKPLQVPRTGQ